MKKILVLLLVLFILASVGLAVFLFTFDADRYRPVVTQKISEALGRPVQLGKIALAWQDGLALSFERFSLPSQDEVPAFSVERAYAQIRLAPLLRGDIRLGALVIVQPKIEATRLPNGEVRVHGFEGLKKPAGGRQSYAPALAGLLIDTVEIREGSFHFNDQNVTAPVSISIDTVDIAFRNLSLAGPTKVKAKFAFLADTPNTEFEADIYPPQGERPARLQNSSLDFDLSAVTMPKLLNAFPALGKTGFREKPLGRLNVRSESLLLDETGLAQSSMALRLSEAKFAPATLASPLENINAGLTYQNRRLEVARADLDFSGGHIQGSGTVQDPLTEAVARFQIQGRDFQISQMAPATAPGEPQLTGVLSFNFDGASRGKDMSLVSQTFEGQGKISVQDPVIRDLNLVRDVLGRLSIIPGLVNRLLARLPEEYQSKLEARDTVFEPIEVPFAAAGGGVNFPEVQLTSDSFAIGGSGRVGLNGAVSGRALLALDRPLSEAFIQSVEELRVLADADGRIQIPLVIQGLASRVQILPDVSHMASQLALAKAQQWVGEMMKKKSAPQEGAGTSQTNSSSQNQEGDSSSSWENALGSLLGVFVMTNCTL